MIFVQDIIDRTGFLDFSTHHIALCFPRWLLACQFDRQELGGCLCAFPAPGGKTRDSVWPCGDGRQRSEARPGCGGTHGPRTELLPQRRASLCHTGLQSHLHPPGLLHLKPARLQSGDCFKTWLVWRGCWGRGGILSLSPCHTAPVLSAGHMISLDKQANFFLNVLITTPLCQ